MTSSELVRDLHFTVWLGKLFALDCIEAPVWFRTPELVANLVLALTAPAFSPRARSA